MMLPYFAVCALLLLSCGSAAASIASSLRSSAYEHLGSIHELATQLTDPLSFSPLKLQVASTSTAQAQTIAVAASLNSLGTSALSSLPRWGFDPNINDVINGSNLQSYAIGVGIQLAYGLVLAILTLLIGCCFCCCRCCCNWCGGREPEPEGYSKCQRWGTFFIMFIFSAAVTLVGLVGWYNDNQMTAAINGNAGVMTSLVNLAGNTVYFLVGTPTSTIQPTGGAVIPTSMSTLLTGIGGTLQGVIGTVQGLLGQTSVIFSGVPALIAQVGAVGASMSNTSITINGTSFACSFCSSVGSQVTSMSNQLQQQTSQPLSSMQTTVTNTNNTLISTSAQIATQLNSTLNTLQSSANIVQPYYNSLQTYQSQASLYDYYRNIAVLVLFAIPVSSMLALLFGGLCKSGCPFTCYYWVGYCGSFLLWISFAIHLPLAVVLNDSCTYLTSVDSNLTGVSTLGSAGTLLNACLYNQSLVAVYNLQSQLNFTSAITFPTIPNIASQFQFSAITNFTSQVMALNLNTFGFYPQNTTDAINTVNSIGSQSFTRATISQCPGASAAAGYSQACNAAQLLTAQEAGLNATLAQMQGNAAALNTSSVNLQVAVTNVYNNVFGSLSTTLAPLFGITTTFVNAAYCGFIGQGYFQLKTAMCNTMVTALAMLSLCAAAVGILNFVVIVCSTMLSKRIGSPAMVQVYPIDDQIEMMQKAAGLELETPA